MSNIADVTDVLCTDTDSRFPCCFVAAILSCHCHTFDFTVYTSCLYILPAVPTGPAYMFISTIFLYNADQ